MALHLKKGSEADGAEYHALKVYDPNVTNGSVRAVVRAPEDLESLTLQGMLEHPEFVSGKGGYGVASTGANGADMNEGITISMLCLDDDLEPRMDRIGNTASSEKMHLILREGSFLDHEAMTVGLRDLEASARFKLLDARPGNADEIVESGLHSSLCAGAVRVTGRHVSSVLDSGLTQPQKHRLLEGARERSVPALFSGMVVGFGDVVEAFMRPLLRPRPPLSGREGLDSTRDGLDPDRVVELLRGKNDEGVPALWMAMRVPDSSGDACKVFADTVLLADEGVLDSATKIELLEAEDPAGVPALHVGMREGSGESVGKFSSAILTSGKLDVTAMKRLLEARDLGVPALAAAMMRNEPDDTATIAAFVEAVLAAPPPVTVRDKIELLESRHRALGHSGSALRGALAAGQGRAIDAFVKPVLSSSGLTPDQKVEILAGRVGDGPSVYTVAAHQGLLSVVQGYHDAIRDSDALDETRKASLLATN